MTTLHTAWDDAEGARRARELFTTSFEAEPHGVWASPGRVNLIGEHVDYNGGFCLPIALPHATYVAAAKRDDGQLRLVTELGDVQRWEGTLDEVGPGAVSDWVAYSAGPLWALRETGAELPGYDLAIVSCVPAGAGLSSSAAVESAVLLAAAELAGLPTDGDARRAELAAMGVRAENEVAGARTGGMDQAASLRSKADHGLLLDCEQDSVEQVLLNLQSQGLELLVVNSNAPHMLADGQYASRRADCERATEVLGLRSLREPVDGPRDGLGELLAKLDEDVLVRRVRHVVTESWRVLDFVEALAAEQAAEAGELMVASHDSLRADYEVTVPELDSIVVAAMSAGALGARMTGGGFGGSCVVLLSVEAVDRVAGAIDAAAVEAGFARPDFHLATAADGGRRIN